jgi:hypothetical protein
MVGAERSVVEVSTRPKALLQGLKWSIPLDVGRAQFLVTRSLQKTLVGLAFTLVVAGVAPM